MSEYVILTDVGADLGQDMVDKLGIEAMHMPITLEGKEYLHYADCRELSLKSFYDAMRGGVMPSTAAVNMDTWMNAALAHLEAGRDVLCIAFSSGLSATAHAAATVAEELSERFPERKIYAVDSLSASLGQGLLVYLAVQQKNAGGTIEAVRDWVLENRLKIGHVFTVDDLHHLRRGGRVSAATAVLGSMLTIKPILHVNDEGRLINIGKARGRAASLKALVDRMEQEAVNPAEQTVFISHGDCLADAEAVADMVRARFGTKEFYIGTIGPIIGAHAGPGTVALFYTGNGR